MRIVDPARFFATFPHLSSKIVQVTSSATVKYNCIAWAAGDDRRWWWPSPSGYWPPGVPQQVTLDAFRRAFGTLGYATAQGPDVEPNKEKVAIYALDDVPTHAARQLPNGKWTSKCGQNVDVEHELHELEGLCYGQVAVMLERGNVTAQQGARPRRVKQ